MRFYKPEDFADSTVPGSGDLMDPAVMALCDDFAVSQGRKFRITSGVRSPARNVAAGGVGDSAHLPKAHCGGKSVAVDIAMANGAERFAIVFFLLGRGVRRIGVYDKHVHFDLDPSLPQSVIWAGISK